jgi:hypothetical protein
VDAMTNVAGSASTGFAGVAGSVWADLLIVVAFTLGLLALGAATLRRRTA